MINPNYNEEIEKILSEIQCKIKDVFGQLRECLNNREKNLLEKIQKIADMTKESEIMNKMMNEMKSFRNSIENISKDLNEKNFKKYEKKISNISNMIEEINIDEKENKKIEEFQFIYDENILNEILNKIKAFGELKQISDSSSWKWKTGPNYILSENNLIATKNFGGDAYNCNILGDIILPKNKINTWKIKLIKFVKNFIGWGILIGVGPSNLNQYEHDLYEKTWTFICSNSSISIKSGSAKDYKVNKRLKEGDIIEVIMNGENGELSFSVNGENYGVACKIPLDIDLSPVVIIQEQGNSIKLLNE